MNNNYNSLSDTLKYFGSLNNNAISLLGGFAQAVSSSEEFVNINNVGTDGIERNFTIPSHAYYIKRINDISNNVEKLYQLKNRELNLPIFSKYVLTEDKKIDNLEIPKTFATKPNFILENLLNPLLYVSFNFTDKINAEVDKIFVRRIIIKNLDEIRTQYVKTFILNRNDLEYDVIIKKLDEQGIDYIIDDDTRDISPTILRNSGNFDIITISADSLNSTKFGYTRKVQLDTLIYFDNLHNIDKQLIIGDSLISSDGDTEFEIISVDTQTNNVVIGRKSGYDNIAIGTDVLRIASTPVGEKIVEIPVNINEYQIIFTKIIQPYFKTISSVWNYGVSFDSNTLLIDNTTTLLEYYNEKVTDYGKFLNTIKNSTDTESIDIISIDCLPLDSKSFKIIDLNEDLVDKSSLSTVTDLLNKKSDLEQEKEYCLEQIDEINQLISAESSSSTPDINKINTLIAERNQRANEKVSVVNEILNILNDIKNLRSNNISAEPYPVIFGAVELPVMPFELKYIYEAYFEYRYKFLNSAKTSSSNTIKVGNSTLNTSFWNTTESVHVQNISLTNANLLDELETLNPDITSLNEIRIPIYNIEPAFIEIQARFCYKLNALSPIQVSDWTESITLNYTDFIVKYNASTLVQLDNEIYTADILKRCNDMELLISNMAERLQKIEDIKTTNSYQYKDVIVLSEYNILNKSFELSKIPSTTNIIVQVIGGQPIAPDEYKVYYKKITWDNNSTMNTLVTGDTLIIEYLI